MLPVLFRIGSFEITSFGVMVALGALAGLWLFRKELARARLPDPALDSAIYGLVGGLLGAKLLYVFEHLDEGSFLSLLLDRGGMSWFGGFVGGLLAGYVTIRWNRWPVMAVLTARTSASAWRWSILPAALSASILVLASANSGESGPAVNGAPFVTRAFYQTTTTEPGTGALRRRTRRSPGRPRRRRSPGRRW